MTTNEARRARASRYTPSPPLPRESAKVYDVMLRVLSSAMSVTAAANELDMRRSQLQTSLHKAQAAFIAALPSGRTGRPKKDVALREAEATIRRQARQNERLRAEVLLLRARLDSTSALIRSQMGLPRTTQTKKRAISKMRSRRSRASPKSPATTETTNSASDSDRAVALRYRLVELGSPRDEASLAAGVAPSTMRRWCACGTPQKRVRSRPRPRCGPATEAAVVALVRSSNGLFGADALRRTIDGVSRRDAAVIKRRTKTAMERERRARTTRIYVSAPGVVRGFDAMHLNTRTGTAYSLRAQDSAIPYTTTLDVSERYDEAAVLATLERDFRDHGAPYVLRLDRASVHRTERVKELCASAGVLILHGPPRCARFYGQLERTHRDLRVFAPLDERRSIREHASELERARVLLNNVWVRRSLGYETAEQRWNKRVDPELDRVALRDEVLELAMRIREQDPKVTPDDGHRHAIVAAMTRREFLRQVKGGHC